MKITLTLIDTVHNHKTNRRSGVVLYNINGELHNAYSYGSYDGGVAQW